MWSMILQLHSKNHANRTIFERMATKKVVMKYRGTHFLPQCHARGPFFFAFAHLWKAPKCAETAHWLEPPTYWATKNTSI